VPTCPPRMEPPVSAAPPRVASEGAYPPAYLCDLAVQLLAAASTDPPFTPAHVWASPNRTRHPSPAQPAQCCLVKALPRAGAASSTAMPFYFGRDDDGYTIVTPRGKGVLALWPRAADGRPKPVRLVRWIMEAAVEHVVRHDCDTPECIAVCHLRAGTQRENLADALARKRRRGEARGLAIARARGEEASPVRVPSERLVRRGVAFDSRTFVSPSKAARKAARAAR